MTLVIAHYISLTVAHMSDVTLLTKRGKKWLRNLPNTKVLI